MTKEDFIQLRENLGLTQTELSEKISISRSTIAKIETGKIDISVKIEKKFLEYIKGLEKTDLLDSSSLINEMSYFDVISENDYQQIEKYAITHADTLKIKFYLKFSETFLRGITDSNFSSVTDIIKNINNIFEIAEKLGITEDEYYNTKFYSLGSPNSYINRSFEDYQFNEMDFNNRKIKDVFRYLILESIKDDLEINLTSRINYLKSGIGILDIKKGTY
ncbi:helix-turn-helix transcriptional regulator [Myroides sp. JBRI-B21084]|uniref:helix-turn-helix domain-containing protein n=1 Tax=Myroides sp. JBRI-B21084 TaxID=3119977 RepID=UPI0026E45BE2|nr:helix-turn-helix transcriptional regulator [Paenimyroides cloacae]WKW46736.1 helix-turn-helix transcriptional regulator [Paenimyroides cloacae]